MSTVYRRFLSLDQVDSSVLLELFNQQLNLDRLYICAHDLALLYDIDVRQRHEDLSITFIHSAMSFFALTLTSVELLSIKVCVRVSLLGHWQ